MVSLGKNVRAMLSLFCINFKTFQRKKLVAIIPECISHKEKT